ncbi:MAG: SET domain-containing protein-lysine N-methyltransferase [Chitinophagaceae bacterium]|nr:SET domain-containing protein-lysine N-methyltransferase [Chitinophagaceae bacterium]
MRLLSLYIDESKGRGRGVFISEQLDAGTVVEIAPVIVMSAGDRLHLDATKLHDYIFEWGEDRKQCAMALGWIPVYNHSSNANCEYFMDFEEAAMFLKTVRDVQQGEELTINYNGDFNDEKPVWFQLSD